MMRKKQVKKNLEDNRKVLGELGLSNLVKYRELQNTVAERTKLKKRVLSTKSARKREGNLNNDMKRKTSYETNQE